MRQTVMVLWISLTLLLFSGCAACTPKVEYVNIPQKCKVPEVEEPIMDNTDYKTYPEIVAKALKNYTAQKEYAAKLKASSEVCR